MVLAQIIGQSAVGVHEKSNCTHLSILNTVNFTRRVDQKYGNFAWGDVLGFGRAAASEPPMGWGSYFDVGVQHYRSRFTYPSPV